MLYDLKNEEEVQDVVVKDVSEIIDDVIEQYKMLRYGEYIAIYAPCNIIYEIAKSLFSNSEYKFTLADDSDSIFEKPSSKDLLLSIEADGDMLVEQARGEKGRFKSSLSTMCYFYDGYSEEDMHWISLTEERILVFGFEDESKGEDKETKESLDTQVFKEDDGMHGFEFSKKTENGSCYYAFYTNQSLSEKFYKEVAEILR